MNWDQEYRKLEDERIDDKIVSGTKTINRIKQLSESNRAIFIEYHSFWMDEISKGKKKFTSYGNYRTAAIDLLEYLTQHKLTLNDLTQNILDEFYFSFQDTTKKEVKTNNKNAFVNLFLETFADRIITELDFNKMRFSSKSVIDAQESTEPLNSEEVDQIKLYLMERIYDRLIFELSYKNDLTIAQIMKISWKNYDEDSHNFYIDEKLISLDSELINLIHSKKDDLSFFREFRNETDFKKYIADLSKELQRNKKLKRMITWKNISMAKSIMTYIKCPHCGESFEAVSENWVIRQYDLRGKMWIVCKENCSKE